VNSCVLAIEDRTTQGVSADHLAKFHTAVVGSLARNGVAATAPDQEADVALTGELSIFDPGSRFARYMVSFGAGTGRLESNWSVKDADGSVMGACAIRGSISGGFFGGSFDSVTDEAAALIGRFMRNTGRAGVRSQSQTQLRGGEVRSGATATGAPARRKGADELRLKDGSIIRGHIMEVRPGKSYRI